VPAHSTGVDPRLGNEKGAGFVAGKLGYPYVMTVQGLLGWYKQLVPLTPYEKLIERLERLSLRRAPVVTTESAFAMDYLRQRYPKLRLEQAEHAPNRSFAQVRRRPQTNPIHFISVGTLGFRKGTDLLFQAMAELAPEMPFRLTMVTSAATQPEQWLSSLPAAYRDRVVFRHNILPNEVAAELAEPTVLLLPTRADTSPNAVKEAVVAGLPVVASRVGGIPDYVFPDRNGLLFQPGDLADFVRAIRAACAHPLFSRGAVEDETLQKMRDYLSPERMAANFLRAYKQATARAGLIAACFSATGSGPWIFKMSKNDGQDEQSCRAWIKAKLVCGLLIERFMREAKFFFPWHVLIPGVGHRPLSQATKKTEIFPRKCPSHRGCESYT
jgi:glycosyltransferase involved in cell wall biosynthesis